MKKILVALSGGVDSAAACLLLRRQGYEVDGATMLLRDGGEAEVADARRVAETLGMKFFCFDWREAFQKNVIDDFTRVYQQGGTPNPCVQCNRTMKFGLFLDKALELGYDGIATGHYARIERVGERYLLLRASDASKDQSYVLYGLTQHQLAHTLFPLGESCSKEENRALAQEAGLEVARKRDSQDICFVPDGDYMAYLTAHGLVPQKGNFITPSGEILGEHRGLGLAFGQRAYVLGKRGTDVILGENEMLFSTRVQVEQVNYIPFGELKEHMEVAAKLRYSAKAAPAVLYPTETGCRLEFEAPQRAVTPGQSAVFYNGDIVIGGGIITQSQGKR